MTLDFSSLKWGFVTYHKGFFPSIKCDNGNILAFILTYSSVYSNLVSALIAFTEVTDHPFVENPTSPLLGGI